jgi:GcrA cell cycle regulator
MDWNEENVATLKQLWPDHSAGQIAAKMGCTRNSIIGKSARLGLTMETKAVIHPLTRNNLTRHKQKDNDAKLILKIVRKNGSGFVRAETTRRDFQLRCVEVVPLNIDLLELKDQSCRYPLGGDEGIPITFCGHSKLENSSYCASHHYLTTVPPKPRVEPYYHNGHKKRLEFAR